MGTLVVNSDFGKLYGVSRTEYFSKFYLTFEAVEDCVFTFTMDAKLPTTCVPSISFSIDDGNSWTETANVDGEEVVVTTPTIKAGDKVLWKSNAVQFCYQPDSAEVGSDLPLENAGFSTFDSSGKYKISGNIMSLLYGDDFVGKTEFKPYVSTGYGAGAFTYLFTWNYGWAEYWDDPTKFNEKIISTKYLSLPATTLAPYCYYGLFLSCSKMIDCPELPATTLAAACYKEMFYLCDAMLEAPKLPALEMKTECYREMIDRCRSLRVAPELPATTLAAACYMGMFNGCTALIEQPELPATKMEQYCYNCMFQNCSSLIKAHKLPQSELAEGCWAGMFNGTGLRTYFDLEYTTPVTSCFNSMFAGCASMTKAPVIHLTSTVNKAIGEIFLNCTSLNEVEIYIPAPTLDENNKYYLDKMWLQNVAPSGVLKVHTNSETDKEKWNSEDAVNVNCVPEGWTVVFV